MHDSNGGPCLPLENAVLAEPYQVPTVAAYRHVGGIVVSTCTPVPDLHCRYAQASGTLKALRRRFFAAKDFPLRTKVHILRALVVSRFAHSVAALVLTAACHARV